MLRGRAALLPGADTSRVRPHLYTSPQPHPAARRRRGGELTFPLINSAPQNQPAARGRLQLYTCRRPTFVSNCHWKTSHRSELKQKSSPPESTHIKGFSHLTNTAVKNKTALTEEMMQLEMHSVQIKKRVSWQGWEPILQNNICRMQTVQQRHPTTRADTAIHITWGILH